MNAEELADVMRKLRNFTSAYGMQWVLDEVDEAVSLGVPETRRLRQSTRRDQTTYEDIPELPVGARASRAYRRAEEFISRRPMTELEEIELLIQALRRVLADLDGIASASIEALNDPSLSEQAEPDVQADMGTFKAFPVWAIAGISFAPDEGSSAPAIDVQTIRQLDHSARISDVLDRIEEEIRS